MNRTLITLLGVGLSASVLWPIAVQANIAGLLGDVENMVQGGGSLPTSLSDLSQLLQSAHNGGFTAIPGTSPGIAAPCPPGFTCKRITTPIYPNTQGVKTELAEVKYLQDGQTGPAIYIFFDPLCPYCYKLFTRATPLIQQGTFTVRYVPVAILGQQSAQIGNYLLGSPNPMISLNAYEQTAFRPNNGGLTEFMVPPNPVA